MPYQIYRKENGILVKFQGTFDFRANTDAASDIYGDPEVKKLRYVIWDTSDTSGASISEPEITTLALFDQLGSSRVKNIKFAMFVTCKEIHWICEQYCAQYQTRHTGWKYLISDDMDEIRNWISS